ncbi:hypothetical protein [Lignipirellula cremea]|uniref:Uncharacterized protein n=1 Tax=Lignipirellula cremea TaxID=2528010 RepID=A0A518DR73_9BACT|nr:hypothetical protein [Lignipirellula cremea]QDU94333.1 hypothetical protein Pla8534_21220 [Lignipirellula cremea]
MTTAFQLFFPAFCATIPAFLLFLVTRQSTGASDPVGNIAILALTLPAVVLAFGALAARPSKIRVGSLVVMLLSLITALAALALLGYTAYQMAMGG